MTDLGFFHNITLFSSRFPHYYSGWTGRTQDAARTERLFDNCIVYAGMYLLVLKKRLASVLSQRKTTIREEKIESSANDFAENCMKYYKSIILL